MQLDNLLTMYIRERALSSPSVFHYRFVKRTFVRDTGVERLEDIDIEVLLSWREATIRRGAGAATWNNYLRHMRALLSYAVDRGLATEPPGISGLILPQVDTRPKTLQYEELLEVVAYILSDDSPFQQKWFWATVVRTLFYTGMRRRQLACLQWRDVYLDRAVLHMRGQASKNRQGWDIPINATLLPSLIELHQRTLEALGPDAELGSRYVFDISLFSKRYRSSQDGYLKVQAVSNFFSRLREQTGAEISAHKMRHTMATMLARLGLYKELQILLGHTNMQTTMRYIHPEMEALRDMTNQLDEIG